MKRDKNILKIKIILILCAVTFICGKGFAQDFNWQDIKRVDPWYTAERPNCTELDNYVRTIGYAAKTPQEIAQLCVKNCTTQYEKARAIFDWLAFNIAYDTSYRVGHGDACFKSKKGVCQGYAELYQMMAKSVGLECEMVTGYGRNIGGGPHAWNIVTLSDEGRKILLDSCWGAGYVNSTFRREFKPWWFDTHPAVFVFSHFPDDPSDELIDNPLSTNFLKNTPYVFPVFFMPNGIYPPEVFDYVMKNPAQLFPQFYTELDNLYMAGVRFKEMYFGRKLISGNEYTFKYINPNGVMRYSYSGCDITEETDENGLVTLHVKVYGNGNLRFMKGSQGALYYTCVTSNTMAPKRKIENHFPAIAKGIEANYKKTEIYFQNGTSLTDGFILQNQEDDTALGNTLSQLAEYCNQKSRDAFLQECFSISPEGEVTCDFSKDGYRIPTVDEWLFALGSKEKLPKTIEEMNTVSWFLLNSSGTAHASGKKQAHNNGLFDMIGGKSELCYDKKGKLCLMGGNYMQDMETILKFEPESFEFEQSDGESVFPPLTTVRLVRNVPQSNDTLFLYANSLKEFNNTEKDIPRYMKYIEYLAEQKDPSALNELGTGYYQGKYWEQDVPKGISLMADAADLGNRTALYNIGYLCETGTYIKKDLSGAFTFYYAAAEKGDVDAQVKVCDFYHYGYVTEVDDKEAFVWLEKAVQSGKTEIKNKYAQFLQNGWGCEKDEVKAFNIFKETEKEDSLLGRVELADCYLFGRGVRKSTYDARRLYDKAYKKGSVYAARQLAYMFANGEGLSADLDKAISYYEELKTWNIDFEQYRAEYEDLLKRRDEAKAQE